MTRLNEAWYADFLRAWLRATAGRDCATVEELEAAIADTALPVYPFKRSRILPRVRTAIGILQGLAPGGLLDIGSGRGTFLWPLMDALPLLPVTAVDLPAKARWLAAVRNGGVKRLNVLSANVRDLPMGDGSFDGVTALEVLEHLPDPARAVREVLRVARRFVLASVPSAADENPEHLRLFGRGELERMFRDAGAWHVKTHEVPGHRVLLARVAE